MEEEQRAGVLQTAYFAGGCFWCMVSPFDVLEGIVEVRSGYMGGTVPSPTYEQVKRQISGHYEVIRVRYDPGKIPYGKLLQAFWRQVDPTDPDGQFHDRGPSYRTAIFYTTEAQRQEALESRRALDASGRFDAPVVTPVLPAPTFYDAEEYHQDFYRKSPEVYHQDRARSGRDEFLRRHWGDEYFDIYS